MPEIPIWIWYQGLRKYKKLYAVRGKDDGKIRNIKCESAPLRQRYNSVTEDDLSLFYI